MRRKFMRSLGLLLTCGIAIVGMAGCGKSTKTPTKEGYNILWADEFDGSSLNTKLWLREERPVGWTNNEAQEYVTDKKNGFVRDGKFVIKGMENPDGVGTYTSCKLRNTSKAAFMYGRIETRAKVPQGKGLWPAIWMMPEDESVYGQWPKCGEIDIMEVLGDQTETAFGTVHYGEPHAEKQGKVTLTGGETFATDFHEYAVEWEPGKLEWFIDGKSYLVVDNWFSAEKDEDDKPFPAPFNQKFCIQMNLAIGGDWPGYPDFGADYMKNAEFEIDYVRVYQKPEYDTNVTKPEVVYRNPDETGNYISDTNFEHEILTKDTAMGVGWVFHLEKDANATYTQLDGGGIKIDITKSGTKDYSVQLYHAECPFINGKTYKVSFDYWGDQESFRIREVCIDAPNAGWQRYWTDRVDVTTTKQTYETTFTYTMKKNDAGARFEFNIGNSSEGTIYLSNVRLEEVTTD
jgi:beta-glucanase (GH16 family)